MKRLRKFIGLAAIAAVLNPLCCCIADVIAKTEPVSAPEHACCAKSQEQQTSEKAPAGGCTSEEGCPHKQGAYQREMPVDAQGLVVAPAVLVSLPMQVETTTVPVAGLASWEHGEQRPPGRHDPPVWLRSHSFLN